MRRENPNHKEPVLRGRVVRAKPGSPAFSPFTRAVRLAETAQKARG